MSDKDKDNFSRILSVVAIAISLVSLGYTIYLDQKSETEDLKIFSSRISDDYRTEIIPLHIQGLPAIIQTYYELILVNNGKQPLSIISYDLKQTSDNYPSMYSYMDGGLLDSQGRQIQLPLDIDPKKSIRFFVKIGEIINPRAFELISNNLTSQNNISINEINYYLAKNGMDFYGNSVEPFMYKGNFTGFKVPPNNRREPVFLITFQTGRDNYFGDTLFWYKIKQY